MASGKLCLTVLLCGRFHCVYQDIIDDPMDIHFVPPEAFREDGALQGAAVAARAHLSDIARLAGAAPDVGASQGELEKLLWASVHGYAHLTIDGQLEPADPPGAPPPDLARFLFAPRSARKR